VHLLKYIVKYTVTVSSFNTHANFSKCRPSACMHFLTRVTRELVTVRNTAASLMLLTALRILLSCSPCVHTPKLSCNPTHCNLMGSDPVTVVVNSVHRHDQTIDLEIYVSHTT
jgi:hypothetical protein